MKCLFTICGRAGSKGVKNKNCKFFLGAPLVHYTLAAISVYMEHCNNETVHICLNTDSEELVKLAQDWGINLFTVPRIEALAGDNAAKIPVIQDTLRKMEIAQNISYDCVVDLDITSPLRTAHHIFAAIEKQQRGKYDVVFSVTEARRNPYFNMVKQNPDGSCEKIIASNYTARQQAPVLYDMNASIYAYNPSFLHSNTSGMLFDGKCTYIEMPDTGILDIDSERDFLLMENIAEFLISQDAGLKTVFEKVRGGTH